MRRANHDLAERLAEDLRGKEILGFAGRSLGTVTAHNGGGYLIVKTASGERLRNPENVQTILRGSGRAE